MDTNTIYANFIKKHNTYPQQLATLIASIRSTLPINQEHPNYNLGTMEKDADIGLSTNIGIASALEFEKKFKSYKQSTPSMSDIEAQARAVFDFLQQHNINLTYEKNKEDILFNNINREQFYASIIYQNALSNTNFFDRHIGNMQILCLEIKKATDFPRNIQGLSQEKIDKFKSIPTEERLDIIYKRGFYHESIHMSLGTTDERKCDTFALLKVMKEHPEHAQIIYDIYNMQRSKIGHTLKNMYGKKEHEYQRAIKNGTMTYLMPNTYQKIAKYAQHPETIPNNDKELIKLTCELTQPPEFTKEELADFAKLINNTELCRADLIQNSIIQKCMKQGNFKSLSDYIDSDNTLKNFMDKQEEKQRENNLTKITQLKQSKCNGTFSPTKSSSEQISNSTIITVSMQRSKKQKS